MLYWFAVDPERPDVLDVGVRNGLWGVVEDAREEIEPLEPGDGLLFFHRDHGFMLCEVESEPYTEKVPVWSEVDYPHRVRISDPMETDRYAHLGEVHDCLRDPETGEPFASVSRAEAALVGGRGGMFRALDDDEIRCLFGRLGWALPSDVEPAPTEEDEEPAGDEASADEQRAAAEEEPADDDRAGPEEAPEERDEAAPAEAVPVADVPEPAEAEPLAAEKEPGTTEESDTAAEAAPGEEPDEERSAGQVAEAEPLAGGADEAPPGTAPRVILAPALGNPASRERYEATMGEGVELDRLRDFLSDEEAEALRSAGASRRARVWGTAPAQDGGSRSQWEETGPGDVILFTGDGEIFASARVVATRRDPDLARELWGDRDGGGTWEFLFFATEPVEQSVPYPAFNEVAGYEAGYRVPRLNVLETERSLRVLGEFPEFGLTGAGPDRAAGQPGREAPGPAAEGPAATEEAAVGEPGAEGAAAIDRERLRVLLFGRRELGRCALCGELLPVDLLAVAYAKPLERCTDEELEDVGNNVMPACRLGCAGLFRQGFVVVEDGVVEAGRREPLTGTVGERVEEIAGNRCEYWHSGSEPYFRWHAREHGGA